MSYKTYTQYELLQHKIRNMMKLNEDDLQFIQSLSDSDKMEIIKLYNDCYDILVKNFIFCI